MEPRQSSTFGQEACPLGPRLRSIGGGGVQKVTLAHFLEPGLRGMNLLQTAVHPFVGADVVTRPTALCSSTSLVEEHNAGTACTYCMCLRLASSLSAVI